MKSVKDVTIFPKMNSFIDLYISVYVHIILNSLQRMCTGWTTEGPEFEPRKDKNYLLSAAFRAQTGPLFKV
jgi:hypothetical protein